MITYVKNLDMESFFEQSEKLLFDHWMEVANNKQAIKLSPDEEKFKALQRAGALFNTIAYEDGKMVGYVILFITPHIHYKEDLFAYVDVIFLAPEYRKSKVGLALIHKAEELAKENGASIISHHCKPNTPLEKIMGRLGYKVHETIFTKLLKE